MQRTIILIQCLFSKMPKVLAIFFLSRSCSKLLDLFLDEDDVCQSQNWTKWFNRDEPSGPCDCETLPELRSEYPGQICDQPLKVEARLENCRIPYDPTLPNIVVNTKIGFRCNNGNEERCLDYEVRFCCP